MKKLKGISVRMIPPETISVNEPTRIDIVTDTTRFREYIKRSKSVLEKLRSAEEILSTIATKIKHRIIIETTKRIKSNVFENGKRFEKIMETLSVETKIRVPVGAVATIPVSFNLAQAYPWIYIDFPMNVKGRGNEVKKIELFNVLEVNMLLDDFNQEIFRREAVFSPSPRSLYTDKYISFLTEAILERFDHGVLVNRDNVSVLTRVEIKENGVIEIICPLVYRVNQAQLLEALKLSRIPLFTSYIRINAAIFPVKLPLSIDMYGEFLYRVDVTLKNEDIKLSSRLPISQFHAHLIFAPFFTGTERKRYSRRADVTLVFTPEKRDKTFYWPVRIQKNDFSRMIKRLNDKYAILGPPPAFMYDDEQLTVKGYYILRTTLKDKVSTTVHEIPFLIIHE